MCLIYYLLIRLADDLLHLLEENRLIKSQTTSFSFETPLLVRPLSIKNVIGFGWAVSPEKVLRLYFTLNSVLSEIEVSCLLSSCCSFSTPQFCPPVSVFPLRPTSAFHYCQLKWRFLVLKGARVNLVNSWDCQKLKVCCLLWLDSPWQLALKNQVNRCCR